MNLLTLLDKKAINRLSAKWNQLTAADEALKNVADLKVDNNFILRKQLPPEISLKLLIYLEPVSMTTFGLFRNQEETIKKYATRPFEAFLSEVKNTSV